MRKLRAVALHLFAGTGGGTLAFRSLGWNVITIDPDARHAPTFLADPRAWDDLNASVWSWVCALHPTLVWATIPPGDEFMPDGEYRRSRRFGRRAFWASRRVMEATRPLYWVIEAPCHFKTPIERGLSGLAPRIQCGSFLLWGEFPNFDPPRIASRYRSITDSSQARERLPRVSGFKARELLRLARAHVPYELSQAIAWAVSDELTFLGTERMPPALPTPGLLEETG